MNFSACVHGILESLQRKARQNGQTVGETISHDQLAGAKFPRFLFTTTVKEFFDLL